MDPGLRGDDEVGMFEIPSVAFEQPPTLVPHSSKCTTQSTSFLKALILHRHPGEGRDPPVNMDACHVLSDERGLRNGSRPAPG